MWRPLPRGRRVDPEAVEQRSSGVAQERLGKADHRFGVAGGEERGEGLAVGRTQVGLDLPQPRIRGFAFYEASNASSAFCTCRRFSD